MCRRASASVQARPQVELPQLIYDLLPAQRLNHPSIAFAINITLISLQPSSHRVRNCALTQEVTLATSTAQDT